MAERSSQMASLLIRLPFLAALILPACAPWASARSATIAHPDDRNAQIEYFVEQPAGKGPWPTIIFLHGHQGAIQRIGGRAFVDWGVLSRFAGRGYLAVSVSLPGYGHSDGPEDFAGPYTQHAVSGVIARLEADHLARPDRLLIQGTSLGAVTAALVGERDQAIAGLVLISGLYDLPAFLTHPRTDAARSIRAVAASQTGGSESALKARSALPYAARIHAPTLILNGARDDRTDPEQARRLGAAINAAGGHATVHIYPDFGHEIPVAAREAEIDAFINGALRR